ncbi:MAG TPA: dTDP-4-dehydrorhamnose reductase [Lachnospiraceae bacterium]|nr:dTDP-4-dehydrorhamnose reductase [Lachnospiraceae bacterium]
MKILVTGVTGQLGYDVVNTLNIRNIQNIGVSSKDFNVSDFESTKNFIEKYMPDGVIHCAAYTSVDKAEDEPEICEKINVEGTKNIATVCRTLNIKMVYISTDYIFPGTGTKAYDINDETVPLSVYGKTKLEGENLVKELVKKYFIVRISWVFGKNGNNFVKTMLRVGREKSEINVVADQIGSPTYTADLAKLLCDMVVTEKYGIYHATNEGYCSWAEFAEKIFEYAGIKCKVNRISSEEYPVKAKRPANSKLSKESLDKAGFNRLPKWQNALERYFKELV